MQWSWSHKMGMAVIYSKLMEMGDQEFVDDVFFVIEWVNDYVGNKVTFGRW